MPELAAKMVAPSPTIAGQDGTTAPTTTSGATASNTTAVTPLADLPPPIPEGGAAINAITPPVASAVQATNTAVPTDIPSPPSLPDIALPIPAPATSLPEVNISSGASDKEAKTQKTAKADKDISSRAPRKTWQTVLAPTEVPAYSNFNYRRVVQPDAIYAKAYNRDNQHLPIALTREDYVTMLFQRVAANDIDATRALLNSGLSANVRDENGETPLSVARRYGAADTAALLVARGG